MNMQRMQWLLATLALLPYTAVAQRVHDNMAMPAMHGHRASAAVRSPDYSDDAGDGRMPGMNMRDDAALGKLMVDRLEVFHGRSGHGQQWDMQAWYGGDTDKMWLRSEGERGAERLADAGIEVLWNHAVSAFWGTQLGVRQDIGKGPSRTWAAFGVQGLAPYWFDVEATGYIGASGRLAARLRVSYDALFTQRLVLQPEFEANMYGKDDPARAIGNGLSDLQFGLRLRYEIRRRIAPYVGVIWTRRFGARAGFARSNRPPATDRQWVAGVRLWL